MYVALRWEKAVYGLEKVVCLYRAGMVCAEWNQRVGLLGNQGVAISGRNRGLWNRIVVTPDV